MMHAARFSSPSPKIGRAAISVASVALVLLAWQLASREASIPMLFPSPLATWKIALALWHNGQLVHDAWLSLARIVVGFSLGTLAGIVLGLLMGEFRIVRLMADPYVQLLRFLPAIAWIPAAMLWLGVGEASKIALLVYTTVFIVALNTMAGSRRVPRNQKRAAAVCGASRWQTFRMVTAPACAAHIVTGMRLALGNCFWTIIAAELLAPKAGLGYLIFSSRTWMQMEYAFVGIIALGVLGMLIDYLFVVVSRRVFGHYLPPARC